jgi:hypothetical protein
MGIRRIACWLPEQEWSESSLDRGHTEVVEHR